MRSDIMQQAQAIRASMDRAAGYLTDRQGDAAIPAPRAGGTLFHGGKLICTLAAILSSTRRRSLRRWA